MTKISTHKKRKRQKDKNERWKHGHRQVKPVHTNTDTIRMTPHLTHPPTHTHA